MASKSLVPALRKDVEEHIVDYAKRACQLMSAQYSLRPGLENIDKYYQMEGNTGEQDMNARIANRLGDKSKYRDVTVPIVMPQVETALGYYMSVFLSGNPIFPVSSSPQYEDAAVQLNSLFAQQEKKAKWARQLIMFWRDGLKYNLHGLEVDWVQDTTYSVDPSNPDKEGRGKEVIWAGNKLKRMDMYNTFFDPRVAPAEVHEFGEFAGYMELYSKIRMKKFMNDLFSKVNAETAIRAFNSGFMGVQPSNSYLGYYIPTINPEALKTNSSSGFDWMTWFAGGNGGSNHNGAINYKNVYQVTKLYARILPSEFGLSAPAPNTPQVWKFYIVNNEVVLYAERLTNIHNYIPIIFGQPIEDGLNYQTKSFAQNVMPTQDTASVFWNAAIASKRRLTHDRAYYDPSRIRSSDINNQNPAAKIPVRPSAYGKPVSDAVYSAPYRDELSGVLVQEAELLNRFADKINGQNAATQGQFTKGNRTLHEYQDVVGHSNTRNQTLAKTTDLQVHAAAKEIVLLNTLQYPSTDVEVPSYKGDEIIKVDMPKLRKAVVEFTVSDGLEPVDKEMNTEEFTIGLQTVQAVPVIGQEYNVPDIFAHMMKLRGADLSEFKKTPAEIQYAQQMGAWQQAAALAAQKGAEFSTPMPQPPDQQLIQQQKEEAEKRRKMTVAQLVAAGKPPSSPVSMPEEGQQQQMQMPPM